ncbi:type II toxin-antitoxin system mRNA interferase toxin, RelE/StbE family [Candidatus Shapirobacteria bacterium]|nr:type II toxin-antitoxin system mRNA interferase toxin, RelE/StbE family [Candidatus Shapirobacteria bacterium]
MPEIIFDRLFRRHFDSRQFSKKITAKFNERVKVFSRNPESILLNDHPLRGNLSGYRAFSITKDIRVVYQIIDDNLVRFLNIGTHNQVYGK